MTYRHQMMQYVKLGICRFKVWTLQNVCGPVIVQKLDIGAEAQKMYPNYNLYFYGEGYVHITVIILLITNNFLVYTMKHYTQ